MTGRIVLSWTLTLAAAAAARADETAERFPYSAFVASEQAEVRSGPGETFYPVLALRQGDAVEVWRHDPGGWCAIRPPEGSFSWISADFIELAGDRTGVVVGSEVNVRVGTHFSDLRDAVQIKLDDGETVDLIEKRVLLSGGQETTWYKIHPPSGEFRWVHARQLVRHPDQLPAPNAALATRPDDNDSVQQASYGESAADDAAAMFAGRTPTDVLAPLNDVAVDAPAGEVLDHLEAALSRMVAAEPTAWSFGELQRRADVLLETAATAGERSRTRLFLGKLARFQDIQTRYVEIAQLRTETSEVDRQLGGDGAGYAVVQTSAVEEIAAPNLPAPAPSNVASATAGELSATSPPPPQKSLVEQAGVDTSRYDGAGRLQQLAGGANQPTGYALMNERGEVTAYVTAAPGVNLRPYLDQEVGINGIRGYLNDKQAVQLTAKRVDVLRR